MFGQEKDLTKDLVSKITQVTVYPEWAYITRSSTIQVAQGNSTWAIRNLPSWVDEESVRVQLITKSKCTLNGTNVKTVFLTQVKDEEIQKKQKELQAFRDQLEDLSSEYANLTKSQQYLNSLTQWGKEKSSEDFKSRKIEISEYADFKNFVEKSQLETTQKLIQLARKNRDSQPILVALENEMNLLKSQASLEQKEIHIELSALEASEVQIKAQYLISGASWYPIYSAWTKGPATSINIQCEAIVQQSTGESWENAQFTLSTIRPNLIVKQPELNPWYVTASQIGNGGKNSPQISQQSTSFSRGDNVFQNGNLIELQNKQITYAGLDQTSANELVGTSNRIFKEALRQIEERGTTVELQSQGSYTLLPNGKPIKMEISRADLKLNLHYSSIPALSKNTYVSGEIQNTSTTPFLPGAVRVYRDGSFIGKSQFSFIAEGEFAEIYMGLEDRIKVTRTLDSKNSATTYFKNKKILKIGYQIDVQNFLDHAIQIEIQDQLPVSQDQEVKIKQLSIEPKPTSQEKGICIWNISLQPKEKQSTTFEFQMEYPEGMKLSNGMELENQMKNLKK